jgi:hypothetical protein
MDPVEFKWRQNFARDVRGYVIEVIGQDGSKQGMTVDSGAQSAAKGGHSPVRCAQGICSTYSTDMKQGIKFNYVAGKPVSYSWSVRTIDGSGRRSEASTPLTFIPAAAIATSPSDNDVVMDPVEFKWQQSRSMDVEGYEILVTDQSGNQHKAVIPGGMKAAGQGGCAVGVCSALSTDSKIKMSLKHQLPDGRANLHSWTVSTITRGGQRSAPSLPKTFYPSGAISVSPDNASVLYPVEFKWRQSLARDVRGYEIVVTGQDGSRQTMTVSSPVGAAAAKSTGSNSIICPQGVCTTYSNNQKQALKLSRTSEGKSVLYSWTVSAIDGQNRRGEPSTPKTFVVQ